MNDKLSPPSLVCLMLGHCAGILFLIALPVWVGTLVAQFGFDAREAGSLATTFLVAAALASMVCAPRFGRLAPRPLAAGGFGVATLVMLVAPFSPGFWALAVNFLVAGASVGVALSMTHGAIGLSGNPHRVYAIAGIAIGVGAIVFLGGTPVLVEHAGGPALFRAYAVITGAAALAALFAFPHAVVHAAGHRAATPLNPNVKLAIAAVVLMGMTQAMTLSLYERIGTAHDFGLARVSLALALLGAATLLPAPAAALLQGRVAATTVVSTMPILQAIFALGITQTSLYPIYVVSGPVMEFNIMFTHTFAFGLLARLDPTGRAVAGTPAMLMAGAAAGPVLGGLLSSSAGFGAVGYAAVVLVALQVLLFNMVRRRVVSINKAHLQST
jgi:predicted MFS family arabinose efflux permease